ncbi:cysteine desulfurase/selenocysteine lyase [Dysgonomonas sp. PFB1-18]|uniref:aminotransferase class V-fold PLP-dependent enzyme n=1 Tax=unclassified Dysgonomonas TaxID=2630389 RepID=UPI002474D8C9|nr:MULTISPECIES: cysteine desulfurase [unclassified Dysgonomonas]MDH6308827.1 cysteine desulfurase/selenocysteine lyase [Dysgonomonas sp. PF1-14]MDH6338477.1 cysteine desulfurase/selenocysteine lyase [Dysgonomonas sp. PF1-16]MDH6380076.1 cysteine desulfurase/selenocysteine lyase [Dysgonomonas sp. PFB1-18]MDH6397305.1 cysteine desulfurase/selenocysteine lyase [Dysgonomonas sp. PF1-23]
MDIEKIRADFPILSTTVYGKPLIYLDNGATTQKPQCVVEEMDKIYYTTNANVHRGVHYLSQRATDLAEESRVVVQQFINAKHSHEIIFTRGTTESINLIAHSFCQQFCNEGDEIIVSAMEHHANIVSWQLQESIRGVKLKVVPINEKGELILEELEKLISPNTRLISVTHVSNVLGTINPVEEIIEIAHRHDIPVLIDAAQSVQHMYLDVQKLDCDFLVFSGHKVYGPNGVGVLYGKEKWLNQMPPYQGGGEMIKTVSFNGTTFNELPFKFEAGTPDYPAVIALATAIKYIKNIGLDSIKAYEDQLLQYCTDELMKIEGVRIYGTADEKSSVVSFLVGDIHHYDMGMLLDKMGIAVRTGHHCAQPLMDVLGVEGTVRVSLAFYNTKGEIDSFIDGVKRVVSMFG